jgi:hypothetical protein
LDIAAANGHVDRKCEQGSTITYAQRPLFLRNERAKAFRPFATFERAVVGRGLAAADVDGDGDADLLMTTNGDRPLLLRNEGGNRGHSLRVSLVGTRSNRSAVGATLRAWIGGRVLLRRVRAGSSYLSQSELPITLGLGAASRVDRLTVSWPSGAQDELRDVPAGRPRTLREGESPAGKGTR